MKKQKLIGHYYLEWLIILIVVIFIFTSWKQVIQKELESQPIVIDRNLNPSPDNKDGSGNNGGSLEAYPPIKSNDSKIGTTGYAPEGLGQPCQTNPPTGTVPNLPGSHEQQGCDTNQGLTCIHGVVQGGGICLKDIYQECSSKNECTPQADGCIYGYCQKFGDVINKPCRNDIDCEGEGKEKFNHVCDSVSKRCKFNLFPQDSGCVLKEQCIFYTNQDTLNEVSCLSTKPLFKYDATYNSTSKTFNITGTTVFEENYYISLLSGENGYEGRFLITDISVSGGNTNITLETTEIFPSTDSYILDLGGEDDGICVINLPLGTKRTLVENNDQGILYPCETNADTLDNFCVEKGRTSFKGTSGQVCNNVGLGCQTGLICTFNEDYNSTLTANKNVIGTGAGASIGGVFINDIGKCAKQVAISREICDDVEKACEKPNICLKQSINDGRIFRYCGRFWDIFDTSSLIGCPTNFTYQKSTNICLSNSSNICYDSSDCVNSCNTSSKTIQLYDLNSATFEELDYAKSATNGEKLIVSKDFGTCQIAPSAIGTYKFSNSVLNIDLFVNRGSQKITKNITFEDTSITDPRVSIIKKSDNSHQINITYKDKYINYTRREYYFDDWKGYALVYREFGLRQGASIYFESLDGTDATGIYNLDYVNVTDAGLFAQINDLNVLEGTNFFPTVKNNPTNYKMISYDSGFKFNYNLTSQSIEFISSDTNQSDGSFKYLNLYPGTSLTFYSNNTTNVSYFHNLTPLSLFNQTTYYNVGVGTSSNATTLLLTDDTKDVFSEPNIGGTSITTLNANVTISSGYYAPDSGYLQLPEMEGVNLFTINIPASPTYGTENITINKRKELYSPNSQITNVQYNYPIGFFVPKGTDYSIEVEEDSILLTSLIDNLTSQVTRINYSVSNVFDNNYSYSSSNKYRNVSRISYGTSSQYINYEITNNFTPPNPKIYSVNKYGTAEANDIFRFGYPYQLDRTQKYIYQTSDTNEINIISTYKNIKAENTNTTTEYNRINIANESSLRKIEYNGFGAVQFENIKYQGDGLSASPASPTNETFYINPLFRSFGYCTPIVMSPFITTSDNSGKVNYFIPGIAELYIKNQTDIDTILKYSSNEIVIGIYTGEVNTSVSQFNNVPNRYIGITGILSYDIDGKFNETLVLSTNTLLDMTLVNNRIPYLFVNNIVPIIPKSSNETSSTFEDGSLIATSCIPNINLNISDRNLDFATKTGYNKIFTTIGNNPQYQFYNIRYYQNMTGNAPFNDIYFNKDSYQHTSNDNKKFTGENFVLYGPISINHGISYLVNNLLLSSLSLQQSIIMNSVTRNIVDRVFWGSPIARRGNYFIYNDTIPFYNGFASNQFSLDLSYKTPLYWSYWIQDLNKIPIEIIKIIYNFNPGNVENDMFYYALAKINEKPYLLFLSTNYTLNNIGESQPIPVLLDNVPDIETLSDKMFMTPFDRKLNYLSSSCN